MFFKKQLAFLATTLVILSGLSGCSAKWILDPSINSYNYTGYIGNPYYGYWDGYYWVWYNNYTWYTPYYCYNYSCSYYYYYSDDGATVKKDLEALGATIEKMEATTIGNMLSVQFGMSEERGKEIAYLAKSYQKIANKRALTDTEMNRLTQELAGFNYKDGLKSLKEKASGNFQSYQQLLDKASEKNGVSPEAIGFLIEQIF